MDFEEVLSICSHFGIYNILIIGMVAALNCFGAMNNLASNFLSAGAEHWCRIPTLDHLSPDEQRRLAIPWDTERGTYDSCRMYDIDWANLTQGVPVSRNHSGSPHAEIIDCQYGWTFDSGFLSTIQTQWSLVCEDEWLMDLVGPTYVAGFWLGSSVTGYLSNKFGRKPTVLVALSTAVFVGTGAALAPNVYIYLVARFFLAISLVIAGIAGSILLMELTPQMYRRQASLVYQSAYSVGAFLLALCGFMIRDFRQLAFTTSIIGVIFISYVWLLPRSPHWLVWKRDLVGAVRELVRIARWNRTEIPAELLEESCIQKIAKVEQVLDEPDLDEIEAVKKEIREEEQKSDEGYSLIYRHPLILLYVAAFTIIWLNVNFTYSAVSFNIDGLFGDVYMNVFISGALELPALIFGFLCLNRLGRRAPIIILSLASVVSASLAIIILVFDLHELDMVATICALVCRSCVNGCWMCTSVLAVEVFPTSVRNNAISMANAISYLITIAAPFLMGTMTAYFEPLPYVIFIVLSLLSAWSAYMLPETHNQPLPESIEDLLNRRNFDKQPEVDDVAQVEAQPIDGVVNKAFELREVLKDDLINGPPSETSTPTGTWKKARGSPSGTSTPTGTWKNARGPPSGTSTPTGTWTGRTGRRTSQMLMEASLLPSSSCGLPGSVCYNNLTTITESTQL